LRIPISSNQKHQKPLKLKMNKNSDKNKTQKKSQDVNFTEMTSSAMTPDTPENLINTSVQIGDFVLVKYEGKKCFQFFVGCVEGLDVDVEVLFLKRNIGNTFYYPSNPEVDTVPTNFIEKILPKPKPTGNSERSAFLLKFEDVDFSKYKMG